MVARVLAFLVPAAVHARLSVLQWNPHYECFASSYTKAICEADAFDFLTAQLSQVDFANVVELGPEYETPATFGRITNKCGFDTTDMFFSGNLWKMGSAAKFGCLEAQDRPFIVQEFASVQAGGPSLIVAGAHFPHSTNWTNLKDAIQQVMEESGVDKVVLLADTNVNSGFTNAQIMGNLGLGGNLAGSSTDQTTCCYPAFPLGFSFDRAIAHNLPSATAQTTVLLDTLPNSPNWAQSPRLHKPVLVQFDTPYIGLAAEGAGRRPGRAAGGNLRAKARRRAALQADGGSEGLALLQLPLAPGDELDGREEL